MRPVSSRMQTAWARLAQSMPTKNLIASPPWDGETLRGERSCRSLTDWRSGLLGHLARHPVAGLGLSSFGSGERVSYWPSSGERAWLSPNVDHLASLSPLDRARTADFRGRVVQ